MKTHKLELHTKQPVRSLSEPRKIIKRLLPSLLIACLLEGCAYSQKNFDDIGKYAHQGDYFAVVYGSTVGVFISGIVDVVSLGGTLTPDEAQETWSSVGQAVITKSPSPESSNTSTPSYNPPSESTGGCYTTPATPGAKICPPGAGPFCIDYYPKNYKPARQVCAPTGPTGVQ